MRKVRAKVHSESDERFDYLFSPAKSDWSPKFGSGDGATIRIPEEERARFSSLKLIPPEDRDWKLVRGLQPKLSDKDDAKRGTLVEYSPDGGGFILYSTRRRRRSRLA